jgi:RNase E specificity factor CsrD
VLGNSVFLLASQSLWWLLQPAALWSLPLLSVVHLLLSGLLVSLHRWLFDLSAQAQAQQQSELELTSRVDELLQDAYLPLSRDSSLPDRLVLLRQTLQHQLRREQEIRQLVRVQGLVDHELAIGNRI